MGLALVFCGGRAIYYPPQQNWLCLVGGDVVNCIGNSV